MEVVDIRDAMAERLGESPGGEQPTNRPAKKQGPRVPQNSGEALSLMVSFIERLISLVTDSEPELAEGLEDVLARVESLQRLAGETGQGRRNGRSKQGPQGKGRETISEKDIEQVLGS